MNKGYTAGGVRRRGRILMLSGVFALAVVGYAVGLRAGVPTHSSDITAHRTTVTSNVRDVVPALTYDEVGAGALRDEKMTNGSWAQRVDGLRVAPAKPLIDGDSRKRSLAERASRRAYNGAPPSIPHPTDGLTDRSCLACHGQQIGFDRRVARGQPHPSYTNCQQCHGVTAPAFLTPHSAPTSANTWIGVNAPTEGPRAYKGAPPAVPHTLHMRTNCAACHGVLGWPGMQTTHPERGNCLQCHAPTVDRSHPGRTLPGAQLLAPIKKEVR